MLSADPLAIVASDVVMYSPYSADCHIARASRAAPSGSLSSNVRAIASRPSVLTGCSPMQRRAAPATALSPHAGAAACSTMSDCFGGKCCSDQTRRGSRGCGDTPTRQLSAPPDRQSMRRASSPHQTCAVGPGQLPPLVWLTRALVAALVSNCPHSSGRSVKEFSVPARAPGACVCLLWLFCSGVRWPLPAWDPPL